MPVEYVSFEEARKASGLRMVVVTGVPSPWGEAAKGILHLKRIPWLAVRLDQGNDAMAEWTGERSGPVAVYEDEPPRGGWAQILLLAERLAPKPALLPADPEARALALGLSHEICGEMGLGWCRRNQGVAAGLSGSGGFPRPVAGYLAHKYGFRPEESELYDARVVEILGLLARRLHAQREAGQPFYLGSEPSAVDVYSATFMGLFKLLPPEHCPIAEAMRPAFDTLDDVTARALDPILLEHRDFMYRHHLELPLSI